LNNTTTSFKRDRCGKVFQYESDGAYVDIGGKSAAFVPLMELVQTGNRFVCCAALAGRTGLLIIRDQDAEGQVTSRRQLDNKFGNGWWKCRRIARRCKCG